jgi:hypothetical protein
MRTAVIRFLGCSALVVCLSTRAPAQAFRAGTNYIGPSVSLATYGSALAFFGNFEHAINEKWGVGVSVGYYSFTGFKYIPIAATANYHFKVTNEKLDPFIGGGLGYNIVSTSNSVAYDDCIAAGLGTDYCRSLNFGHSYSSGIFPIINGGVRYWLKDNLALVGRVGYGIGFLSAGIDFKM